MIPLCEPNLCGKESEYVLDCIQTNWVSSVGSYVTEFEKRICDFTGAGFAVATSNGTAALHISLLLSDIGYNDYVIVPNITFIASVNAIKYTGADPLFIDIRKDTWQMDTDLLKEFLEKEAVLRTDGRCYLIKDGRRIAGIMPVHVLGNMGDMKQILDLAKVYSLKMIEDASEALGSFYNGKHAGTFAPLGCFSFNGNKIITTGGGGMIVTDNEQLARKAKHLTTQAKSSQVEYYHDEIGYNYRLVNILAAMGVAQMEQLPGFLKRKSEIKDFYKKELSGVEDLEFQQYRSATQSNNWLFTILSDHKKLLTKELQIRDIQVRPLWVPMNQLPMFKGKIYITMEDISDKVYRRSLSLPCSTGITNADMEVVCSAVKTILAKER